MQMKCICSFLTNLQLQTIAKLMYCLTRMVFQCGHYHDDNCQKYNQVHEILQSALDLVSDQSVTDYVIDKYKIEQAIDNIHS